jgi:hypothetical protein
MSIAPVMSLNSAGSPGGTKAAAEVVTGMSRMRISARSASARRSVTEKRCSRAAPGHIDPQGDRG